MRAGSRGPKEMRKNSPTVSLKPLTSPRERRWSIWAPASVTSLGGWPSGSVPQGRVIAVDIQQGMLGLLAENLRQREITNVDSVLASPDDPGLPRGQVDLVLLVDVYHELAEPEKNNGTREAGV